MSTYGRLPAYIRCRSSVQFLYSRRIWRTVCGPSLHWHLSVSALLIACRYARRLILLVRIYVMTELIALCVLVCVVSIPFPGRTPSLKSLCFAFFQDISYLSLIVWRIVVLVVAIRICRESGSGGGLACAREFGLWPVASFTAWSAALLPGTLTCAGIHQSWTSHPWSQSLSSACIALTTMYCPKGHLGFAIA